MLKTTVFLDDDEEEDSESESRDKKIKSKFYSQLGKQRLSGIWKDQKLDREIQASFPVSMLVAAVGPSEAYLKEKVMEYMQHYLQNRSKINSVSKVDKVEARWNWGHNYDTKKLSSLAEQKYEDLLKEKSETRRVKEESKIYYVLEHPVNILNSIEKRIRKLEEHFQSKNKHPLLFVEADEKVKVSSLPRISSKLELSKEISERPHSTKFDNHNGKLSASSGFHEMTPSPDFSNLDKNAENSEDSLDELSEDEYCQKHFLCPSASTSIDEPDLIYNTQDALIENAFKDKINLFDEVEKLVGAYDRKLIVSEEFSQELGQNLSTEYFS